MQRKRLGRNGRELSVVGFGAWEAGKGSEWGKPPPDDQIVAAIASVFESGINWIDTAEVYGHGTSEEFVGRAVAGRREEIRIATKVAPRPTGTGFRPEQVAEACRKSLKRLGTDHIDLYQLHWRDSTVPVEETWGAMSLLIDEGLVLCIGVSNFDQDLIERCLTVRHVDSLQQEFSMLVLEDRDLIRWCGEQGVGVLAYGPLAFGLLTGGISMETTFPRGDHRADSGDTYDALFEPTKRRRALDVADGLRPIAERLGYTLSQLALAWTFHQEGVTAAIAGSRDPAHVRDNAAAGDLTLDEATLGEIDSLLLRGPAFGD